MLKKAEKNASCDDLAGQKRGPSLATSQRREEKDALGAHRATSGEVSSASLARGVLLIIACYQFRPPYRISRTQSARFQDEADALRGLFMALEVGYGPKRLFGDTAALLPVDSTSPAPTPPH